MELTDINPFKGFKFKKTRKDSEAKNAYTKPELHRLFSTEIHTKNKYLHPHYYWLPILGALTGARLNELCQLHKADVQQIEGIWALQINDQFEGQKLKNNFSRRIIPLHHKLIELGFIDYIRTIKGERLFPELKNTRDGYGSAASKWFGRFKTQLGFGRGYDFHSLRHTVATQLKQQSVSPIVAAELLGHAQNNITYDTGMLGTWTDKQIPNTYSHYADFAMETLLVKMLPVMAKETGLNLIPTYSYARIYKKGDELKRHKDRPSCEISTTLNLGGDPWPIFIDGTGADSVIDEYKNIHKPNAPKGTKVLLEVGDMLVYSGCELEHWREPFEGDTCGQVFLHYNHVNGPFAEKNRFDKRPMLGVPPIRNA